MSLATRVLPGRIEPSKVFFGKKECTKIVTVDESSGLGGKFFFIDVPLSPFDSSKVSENFYVWYDVDNGSADPAPGGTSIEVDISSGDDSSQVANATKAAFDALGVKRFRVVIDNSNELTIENREMGLTAGVSDTDTTFAFTTLASGTGGDLGATQGGITLSQEFSTVDITSDQTGELILEQIFQGGAISMEMGLQEMDAARWDQVVGAVVGSSVTPAGGTQVTGVGEDKLFQSFLQQAGQLTLKPLSTADGDNSRNITFWRAAPVPSSINFDNEIQAMQVTFNALLDSSVDSKINSYIFGDQDQDGLNP